jgi:hypothetical protein
MEREYELIQRRRRLPLKNDFGTIDLGEDVRPHLAAGDERCRSRRPSSKRVTIVTKFFSPSSTGPVYKILHLSK